MQNRTREIALRRADRTTLRGSCGGRPHNEHASADRSKKAAAEILIKNGTIDNDIVVVSPDLGGVTRARDLADRVNAPIAIIEKRRPRPGVAEVMNIIGDIKGKTCILVDDIVDTAGSLCGGAKALKEMGASRVFAACAHAVLTDPAVERIQKSVISELIITNTIPLPPEKQIDKIKVLSVAPLLGEAIMRIFHDVSVSRLFDK